MKKKLIAIGVMCALVAAFIAGYFFLWEEAEPPYAGPEDLVYLFRYERPPLSILLESEGNEPFTLVRLDYDPQRNLTTDSTIEGKEDLPLDTARISGVLSASRNLVFLELVHERVDDLSVFGLAPPRGRVVLDFEEFGSRTLLIGDIAPGNIGVYVMLDASPAIYLCPLYTVDNFLRPYLDYLNMNITPASGWPIDFDTMTFGGRVRQSTGEITLVTDEEGIRLDLPIRHELNPYVGPGILHSVFGMQAIGIAIAQPSGADLADFGFDDPWAWVCVAGGEGGDFTLYATEPDAGGMVFLYREGVPLLYMAMANDLPWLDVQFYELMLPFAVSPLLEELYRIEVLSLRGIVSSGYSFTIEHGQDEVAILFEDTQLDVDNFRRFFITLTSASLEYVEDHSNHQPQDPEIIFIYRYRTGQERRVIFFPSDIPLRHFIQVDDGMIFLVPSSYVERVVTDLGRVISGQHVEAY